MSTKFVTVTSDKEEITVPVGDAKNYSIRKVEVVAPCIPINEFNSTFYIALSYPGREIYRIKKINLLSEGSGFRKGDILWGDQLDKLSVLIKGHFNSLLSGNAVVVDLKNGLFYAIEDPGIDYYIIFDNEGLISLMHSMPDNDVFRLSLYAYYRNLIWEGEIHATRHSVLSQYNSQHYLKALNTTVVPSRQFTFEAVEYWMDEFRLFINDEQVDSFMPHIGFALHEDYPQPNARAIKEKYLRIRFTRSSHKGTMPIYKIELKLGY